MRRLVLVSFVLASCSDTGGEPAGSVHALFGDPTVDAAPAYGTAPFPSDAYMDADGFIGVVPSLDYLSPRLTDALQSQLSTLDGFATRPAVEIFLDGQLDETSLPSRTTTADEAIFVVDEAGAVVPYDFIYDVDLGRIAGSPVTGVLLTPGGVYHVIATNALRGVDGPLARDRDFGTLLRAKAADLPARHRSTRAAVDLAVSLGVPERALVAVATFRVAHVRDTLLAARERMNSEPAPTLTFPDPAFVYDSTELANALGTSTRDMSGVELPGWDNPTGIAHDHVAAVASGMLTTVRFRRPDLTGAAADFADSGTFELGVNGEPLISDPAYLIPISIALPNTPMPTNGFPVMLYGHGLGASRHQMMMMLETATKNGFAVLAIDASSHGSRYKSFDAVNNFSIALPSFNGVTNAPDGYGDSEGFASALQLFHNFRNISAMRDEMRQTVLDWSQVVRLVTVGNPDLSPLGVAGAKLDPAHIVYLGESFGGVIGGLFAAVEPELNGVVLNVPGGGFVDLAGGYSPTLSPLVQLGVAGTYGSYGNFDRFHAMIGFANAMLDGADPIAFAPVVLHRQSLGALAGRPRDILLLESICDEIMSNVSTEAMSIAMGVEQLGPEFTAVRSLPIRTGPVSANVGGRTGLLLQFAPATHGENWSRTRAVRKFLPFFGEVRSWPGLPAPVTISNPVREIRGMIDDLLQQTLADQVWTVTHPAPPVHDFDDDGLLDDVDPDPYTPAP